MFVSATLLAVSLAAASRDSVLALPGSNGAAALRSGDAAPALLTAAGAETLALPAGTAVRDVEGSARAWWAAGVAPAKTGTRLVVIAGDGHGAREIAAPAPGAGAPLVHGPIPVVREGALAGLAWLEGRTPGAYAVRWAPRRGEGWGEASLVAPAPVTGTRLSLAAAALPDGGTLLAWSAFDGQDDEVWFTRSTADGRWSAPERVGGDDRVPDITPTLRATADGALLAWSEYDGNDYRLRVARFDGTRWSEPATVGGRGAGGARFAPEATPRLLFYDVEADGWTVAELDPHGRATRTATAAGRADVAPRVSVDGDGAAFRFDDDAKAAVRAPWHAAPAPAP